MNTPKTLQQWIVLAIIVMAVIAILVAAAHFFGFVIPQIVWYALGIVAGAVFLIFIVKFLFSLGGD